tara:strand:- start:6074 stop:7108 length:1035 start_codon:yes stop_codon:yes gene_type:complete
MIINNFLLILVLINLFIFFNFEKLVRIILFKFDILDHPNTKLKKHSEPIPLFGGIWIYVNLLVFFLYFLILRDNIEIYLLFDSYIDNIILFLCFTGIFCVGLYDDVYNLDPNKKFLSFFFIILCFLLLIPDLLIQNLEFTYKDLNLNVGLRNSSLLFTSICVVALINAINMLDGIDGQVALYSLFFLIIFQIFVYSDLSYFLITLVTFLIFFFFLNISGKIFIGNSGSYLLGFIFSYLLLSEYKVDGISINFIFMLVILPALELIRVFFIRIINGKNPFKGDRQHLHHLLLKRFTKFQSIVIFQVFFLSPFVLNYLGVNRINTLIFSLVTYIILIFFLKRVNFS